MFSKEIQVSNAYVKRYSISLVIREMQVETTMRYYFISTHVAKIKITGNNKC